MGRGGGGGGGGERERGAMQFACDPMIDNALLIDPFQMFSWRTTELTD